MTARHRSIEIDRIETYVAICDIHRGIGPTAPDAVRKLQEVAGPAYIPSKAFVYKKQGLDVEVYPFPEWLRVKR